MKCLLFITIVMLITFFIPVHALTIHVPEDYPLIQQAIDAADNGDIILVSPGTYPGDNRFSGKNIMIKAVEGSKRTVIDCEYNAQGFIFSSAETRESILDGFTITHGYSSGEGGGIICWGASPVSS